MNFKNNSVKFLSILIVFSIGVGSIIQVSSGPTLPETGDTFETSLLFLLNQYYSKYNLDGNNLIEYQDWTKETLFNWTTYETVTSINQISNSVETISDGSGDGRYFFESNYRLRIGENSTVFNPFTEEFEIHIGDDKWHNQTNEIPLLIGWDDDPTNFPSDSDSFPAIQSSYSAFEKVKSNIDDYQNNSTRDSTFNADFVWAGKSWNTTVMKIREHYFKSSGGVIDYQDYVEEVLFGEEYILVEWIDPTSGIVLFLGSVTFIGSSTERRGVGLNADTNTTVELETLDIIKIFSLTDSSWYTPTLIIPTISSPNAVGSSTNIGGSSTSVGITGSNLETSSDDNADSDAFGDFPLNIQMISILSSLMILPLIRKYKN